MLALCCLFRGTSGGHEKCPPVMRSRVTMSAVSLIAEKSSSLQVSLQTNTARRGTVHKNPGSVHPVFDPMTTSRFMKFDLTCEASGCRNVSLHLRRTVFSNMETFVAAV